MNDSEVGFAISWFVLAYFGYQSAAFSMYVMQGGTLAYLRATRNNPATVFSVSALLPAGILAGAIWISRAWLTVPWVPGPVTLMMASGVSLTVGYLIIHRKVRQLVREATTHH